MPFKAYLFQFVLFRHKNFMFLKNRVPTLYYFFFKFIKLKNKVTALSFLIWVFKRKNIRFFVFYFEKIFENITRKKSKVLALYFLFFILIIECLYFSIYLFIYLSLFFLLGCWVQNKSKVEHRHSQLLYRFTIFFFKIWFNNGFLGKILQWRSPREFSE